jgi:hypothetical protein
MYLQHKQTGTHIDISVQLHCIGTLETTIRKMSQKMKCRHILEYYVWQE